MRSEFPQELVDGRTQYLDHYFRVVRSIRNVEPKAVVELMLLVGDGSNPHGSRFNLPLRVDVMSGPPESPQISAVELDEIPWFEPFEFELQSGRTARISPFPWNQCDVLFHGSTEDWSGVLTWFNRWFDPSDERVPDKVTGLSGVIHSITEPALVGSFNHFSIDFGSAPLESLQELITVVDSLGYRDLAISYISETAMEP